MRYSEFLDKANRYVDNPFKYYESRNWDFQNSNIKFNQMPLCISYKKTESWIGHKLQLFVTIKCGYSSSDIDLDFLAFIDFDTIEDREQGIKMLDKWIERNIK